ncbi:MAG TPA: sulfatase, partial [Vicinamibacteria bacterium]|nr:sulfatase [Vicinamibacteria bacterium]
MRRPPPAVLARAALALGLVVGCRGAGGQGRPAPPRPSIVLVTLDTTRADRVGAFGSAAGATPRLDGLAAQGLRFPNAYAHAPMTFPSHASILTGLLPPGHGIRDNGPPPLDASRPLLAELLARSGYRTAAFVSAFVLDRRFGLARGFHHYADEMRAGPSDGLTSVPAAMTVDRALAWLSTPDPRPFFAWVHLFDPHDPYEPPEPFATRFRGRPYEGEIAYMDHHLGRLLDALDRRADADDVLVLAVGDHGESLGEHGEDTHAYFIYAATQRVPLVLRWRRRVTPDRTAAALAGGVDVAPTLLDAAGIAPPADLDGRSLLSPAPGGPRAIYMESMAPRRWWGASELVGLRDERWLFVRSPRPELYDVTVDPAESRNLAASHPERVAEMEARLAALALSEPPVPSPEVDGETAARLRALGYLGGGAPPPASGPTPDAKDHLPLVQG